MDRQQAGGQLETSFWEFGGTWTKYAPSLTPGAPFSNEVPSFGQTFESQSETRSMVRRLPVWAKSRKCELSGAGRRADLYSAFCVQRILPTVEAKCQLENILRCGFCPWLCAKCREKRRNVRTQVQVIAKKRLAGGEGGIRTPDTRQGMAAFEAARFNHSRTSPRAAATGRSCQPF